LNVKQRADSAGTFRHVNVTLMETMAQWIPTTPEMEVKVMMGRHLWLVAQAADRFGRRAKEFRAPLHHSLAPAAPFAAALAQLSSLRDTPARIAGLYGPAFDALDRAYAAYARATDPVIDEPSVIVIEDVRREIERMRKDRDGLLAEFPGLAQAAPGALQGAFAAAGGIVAAVHAERESA
jgi:hypothetical protein